MSLSSPVDHLNRSNNAPQTPPPPQTPKTPKRGRADSLELDDSFSFSPYIASTPHPEDDPFYDRKNRKGGPSPIKSFGDRSRLDETYINSPTDIFADTPDSSYSRRGDSFQSDSDMSRSQSRGKIAKKLFDDSPSPKTDSKETYNYHRRVVTKAERGEFHSELYDIEGVKKQLFGHDRLDKAEMSAEPEKDNILVGAKKVTMLNTSTFDSFLKGKYLAWVMFYNSRRTDKDYLNKYKNILIKGAGITFKANTAYTAIDCAVDEGLCKREGVKDAINYWLYHEGKHVDTIEDAVNEVNPSELRVGITSWEPKTCTGCCCPE